MGRQTAEVLQSVIASASVTSSSIIATIVGIAILAVTASGVFGEKVSSDDSVPAGPCTRCQFRVGRRLRILAYRLADY